MKKKSFVLVLLFLLVIISCQDNDLPKKNIVVGISADIETLNPLFSFTQIEGNINELLFLSLVRYEWNSSTGSLDSYNMLADNVDWGEDSSSVTISIRDNIIWSDSTKLTVNDIIFSFELYADPEIQSRAVGTLNNFYFNDEGRIDVDRTFAKISDSEFVINFKPGAKPSTFDFDLPVLPKHVLDKLSSEELKHSTFNENPVTSGPFTLQNWQREQRIILKKNKDSFLVTDKTVDELIFKIVPDYNSSVLQLKSGELDLIEEVKSEDAEGLDNQRGISIGLIKGRSYDYIGWNLKNPKNLQEDHELFANLKIRKALTQALNIEEVLETYLYNYGDLSSGPISSIFVESFDSSRKPIERDIESVKSSLSGLGWQDSDNDGILEKDGNKFKFDLAVPTGNPLRKYAATIFANNLKSVGISANVEFLEMNTFVSGLFGYEYDAWMVGWSTPIPLDLKIQWYSDLDKSPFNFGNYSNIKVDSLIEVIDEGLSHEDKNIAYKKLNQLIYEDYPFTFLYWIDSIVAYNSRIKGIEINPLGVIHNCWKWGVE